MRNLKKWLTFILALAMVFSLSACAGEISNSEPPSAEAENTEAALSQRQAALNKTADWLLNEIPEPTYGAVGGEWAILGLARSGVEIDQEYFESYGERLAAYTAEQGGVLHARKYTEYSRVILAWTAIGRNPVDVGGFNLLLPLADYEQTVFQGINGPIFALLALDSGNYEIPEKATGKIQATRELYIDYIINAEITGGGWSLSGGDPEADLTAMALQALAKYRDRQDVADAVERGLAVLSQLQDSTGGFSSGGADSSESVSQAIVALAELGISVEDERFVKNGSSLEDRLLQFQCEDGGFGHQQSDESDMIATEQAFYALVALERMEQGKSSLYTMN